MEIKRKEGESTSSLVYRFSRRVSQSGIILDVKSKRFKSRAPNARSIKQSALHRLKKSEEYRKMKKLGLK